MLRPTAHRRRRVGRLVAAGLTLLGLGGGATAWLATTGPTRLTAAAPAIITTPILTAVTVQGPRAAARWDAPLTLRVADGTLSSVTVLDPDGAELGGELLDPRTWRSTASALLPAATYRVTATLLDAARRSRTERLVVTTTPAAHLLHAVLSPRDGDVVGVGMPVIIDLDHPVTDRADRAAIEDRLTVTTVPAVAGAWRWMDGNRELHYRGPSFWAAGTRITVRADLRRLPLSGGTWGSGIETTSYRIGDAVISTVDVTAHLMTVRRNGVVLRVAKVSTGRDAYPSKGGIHLVLEKIRVEVMDSATVGIPRDSPDGYYEKVPYSVRISYGGAFVHSADWSVKDQGVRNVSHGCVNMSPADAAWFYALSTRGDVVNVVHSAAPPVLSDPGTSDWNIAFSDWAN